MQHKHLRFGSGFRVILNNSRAQAAEMTLEPGKSEGGPDNNHRGADQWFFVVQGKGIAKINHRRIPLQKNTLVLIERGDNHEIVNTGTTSLRTLNWYVPPAYTKSGNELRTGKSMQAQS